MRAARHALWLEGNADAGHRQRDAVETQIRAGIQAARPRSTCVSAVW